MKSKITNKAKIATILVLAIVLVLPVVVKAQSALSARPENVTAKIQAHKEQAKLTLEEKMANREVKSEAKRQEVCERRVAKLQSAMTRLEARSTKLLGVIDSFYTKVTGFYSSGQLTVSNYDELLDNVDTARATATDEVAVLGALNEDIDCTDPEVTIDVATFKESAVSTKEVLKAYRKTLVELISSMRAQSAEDNNANKTEDTSTESDDSEVPALIEPQTETEAETPVVPTTNDTQN